MKTMLGTVAALLVACAATDVAAAQSVAQTTPAAATPASPWRLGIALGYGERSNPLIQSDDIPVALDLDIAWFGKRWFFDNGDVGFALVDDEKLTANLVGRVNSDRVFFGKTNTRFVQVSAVGTPLNNPTELKPPDRDYAVELGVEVLMDGRWGQATFSAYRDVSGTHEGVEVAAEYGYRWNRGRWSIAPTLGIRYKDAPLNDYFWGIRAEEANAALPAYRAQSGVNWQAGVRAGYYFTRHLKLALSVSHEKLDRSIADSPLVTEDDVVGYFGGLAYQY
jgi:outer membrane protein